MDRAFKVLLVVFLICGTTQAVSLFRSMDKPESGFKPIDGTLQHNRGVQRRQDYGKNTVNWEQIFKLKTLLDQVGRRR